MRILVLAKRYYTNRDTLLDRFGRCYQLPLNWSRMGHTVSLQLLDYRGRTTLSSNTDGFEASSWPARYPGTYARVRRAALEFRPDVVISAGDNLMGLFGIWLARSCSALFVLDAYDDYRSFGSSRIFLGWNAFDWLRLRADATFYASQALADRHPGERPSLVVPNAVAPSDFLGHRPSDCRREYGLPPDSPVVGYFGSMEGDRGVQTLIEAIEILRTSGRQVSLLLAGRIAEDSPVRKLVAASHVKYLGLIPHSRIPALMAACDVLALPYLRSQIMDMGASCKIGEYLYSQRPIAATDTPNFTANFPDQAKTLEGRLARPGDAEDLARVIAIQLQDPRIAESSPHLSWDAVAATSALLLGRLAGSC